MDLLARGRTGREREQASSSIPFTFLDIDTFLDTFLDGFTGYILWNIKERKYVKLQEFFWKLRNKRFPSPLLGNPYFLILMLYKINMRKLGCHYSYGQMQQMYIFTTSSNRYKRIHCGHVRFVLGMWYGIHSKN